MPWQLVNDPDLRDRLYGDPRGSWDLARRGPLAAFGQALAAVPADGRDEE